MSEWQPIETAPIERQKIIIWDTRGPNPHWVLWQTDPEGPHPSQVKGITHWRPDLAPPKD